MELKDRVRSKGILNSNLLSLQVDTGKETPHWKDAGYPSSIGVDAWADRTRKAMLCSIKEAQEVCACTAAKHSLYTAEQIREIEFTFDGG